MGWHAHRIIIARHERKLRWTKKVNSNNFDESTDGRARLNMSRVMDLLPTIILYGVPMSLSLCVLVTAMLWRNPRLLLQDYPKDVQAAVPPKSPAERRASIYWGAIFFWLLVAFPFAAALTARADNREFLDVFLAAFGVAFLFNVADWLILDWLFVCTITPAFIVIPGTAGMAGYKNYGMHFRGFVIGSILSIVLGLLVATIVGQIPARLASLQIRSFAALGCFNHGSVGMTSAPSRLERKAEDEESK